MLIANAYCSTPLLNCTDCPLFVEGEEECELDNEKVTEAAKLLNNKE